MKPFKINAPLGMAGICIFLILFCLNLATTESSSPEWIYSVEWINIFTVPILVAFAVLSIGPSLARFIRKTGKRRLCLACFFASAALYIIPFLVSDYSRLSWQYQYLLSLCWGGAFLLTGLAFFTIAPCTPPAISALLCFAGSLALGLGALELALLCSSQHSDGIANLSTESRYLQTEAGLAEYLSWSPGQCGPIPGKLDGTIPAFHRMVKFNADLFDVRYDFNSAGWRSLPAPAANAKNDLILFGCSFTFGWGLENEQTWAWQLARLLGSDWKLENYSANGYSANHMLCLLERHLIDPPRGKNRFALFLAIANHLRRNEFYSGTPHYELSATGKALGGGNPHFHWLNNLPHSFNGSQLARELGAWLTNAVMQHADGQIQLYLAMLEESARILRQDYDTQLIVLLWPDLENLQQKIAAMGVTALLARPMLVAWDGKADGGDSYAINPHYDPHPNARATSELAAGLASYFKALARHE